MHNNLKKTNVMKATISNIIVAFIYVGIIFGIIYVLFSNSISRAISLIDFISVQTTEKVLKDVKIDLTTKNLVSYPKYETKYGQMKIPSINVDLPLYYGDTLKILRYGVGHSSGSYFPGEGGSILCMGHNYSGYLKRLPETKNGDKIIIETTYGTYTYEIYDTKIVNQKQLDAAPIQREKEILMLYTCYPINAIGHPTQRIFVYANLVDEQVIDN